MREIRFTALDGSTGPYEHHLWSNPLGYRLTASRQEYWVKRIDNSATEGVQHLKDMRWIEKVHGPGETFSYA